MERSEQKLWLLIFATGRRTELLASGNDRHVFGVHLFAAVPRETALDDDLFSDFHRRGAPSQTPERSRRTQLETPIFDLAGFFVLNIDVEPGMWIRPSDLRHKAPERYRLMGIKFGSESMVSQKRRRRQNHTEKEGQNKSDVLTHRPFLQTK